MEKILSVFLTLLMLFLFTSCGGEGNISRGNSNENAGTPAQESSKKDSDDFSRKDDISDFGQTSESESAGKNRAGGNILIVYFSRWGNTDYPDDVDASTSASIVVDENMRYGTTEYIAEMIADETGGDLYRIETVVPYTTDFDELRDVNHDEMNRNYLPELKEGNLDIDGYDTVFVGYPVWWGEAPRIVSTFMESYDFSGKTIVPFCTSGGSGVGASATNLERLTNGADWLSGRRLRGSDSQETVMEWVNSLGLDFGE